MDWHYSTSASFQSLGIQHSEKLRLNSKERLFAMPEAHLESNSGVMESFPGAFPALSLARVSKTSVEDVERVWHMLIRIKVRQIWQSQRHIGELRLLGKERV